MRVTKSMFHILHAKYKKTNLKEVVKDRDDKFLIYRFQNFLNFYVNLNEASNQLYLSMAWLPCKNEESQQCGLVFHVIKVTLYVEMVVIPHFKENFYATHVDTQQHYFFHTRLTNVSYLKMPSKLYIHSIFLLCMFYAHYR